MGKGGGWEERGVGNGVGRGRGKCKGKGRRDGGRRGGWSWQGKEGDGEGKDEL